jgi:hypothetical protein
MARPWIELEHVSAEEAVYGVSQAHVRKSRQRGRPRIPGASSNSSRGCGEESHLGEEGIAGSFPKLGLPLSPGIRRYMAVTAALP